jgi:hypothetical protein
MKCPFKEAGEFGIKQVHKPFTSSIVRNVIFFWVMNHILVQESPTFGTQYVLQNFGYPSVRLHGVITQETTIRLLTAVEAKNL